MRQINEFDKIMYDIYVMCNVYSKVYRSNKWKRKLPAAVAALAVRTTATARSTARHFSIDTKTKIRSDFQFLVNLDDEF